jgi:hypothetical protein
LVGDLRETRLADVRICGIDEDVAFLEFDGSVRVTRFDVGTDLNALLYAPDLGVDPSGVIPRLMLPHLASGEEFTEELVRQINDVFHGNTSKEARRQFAAGLWYSRDGLRSQFQAAGFGQKWQKNTATFFKEPTRVSQLRRLLLAKLVPSLLQFAAAEVEGLARGVAYIGPFRATPLRSYRVQDLAIDAIDPRGSNLTMFLRSLSATEMESLNNWIGDLFQFHVEVEADGSQDRINITFLGRGSYNLVDTGFGLSQLLPVLVQLWAGAFRTETTSRLWPLSVLVIEQPELHLHPHQQALLARALASVARKDPKDGPRMVIETHSEAIVSELGELVSNEKLSPEDVSVLVFEPDAATDASSVRRAEFMPDGGLKNWPIGFFSA